MENGVVHPRFRQNETTPYRMWLSSLLTARCSLVGQAALRPNRQSAPITSRVARTFPLTMSRTLTIG